jgi:hypothetical protein
MKYGCHMNKFLLATLFSAISATSVQAVENQKTVCSHGNQTRVIEVVYTTGDETPCEVRYSKEDGVTTPWSANNLAGFCEKKAAAFIDKQETWGWACEAAANEPENGEMAVSASENTDITTAVAIPETAAMESPVTEAPAAESTDTATSAQ